MFFSRGQLQTDRAESGPQKRADDGAHDRKNGRADDGTENPAGERPPHSPAARAKFLCDERAEKSLDDLAQNNGKPNDKKSYPPDFGESSEGSDENRRAQENEVSAQSKRNGNQTNDKDQVETDQTDDPTYSIPGHIAPPLSDFERGPVAVSLTARS